MVIGPATGRHDAEGLLEPRPVVVPPRLACTPGAHCRRAAGAGGTGPAGPPGRPPASCPGRLDGLVQVKQVAGLLGGLYLSQTLGLAAVIVPDPDLSIVVHVI